MKIRFENVTKRFRRTVVVDRLNLEIRDGEMMVLLGPSGCGKTTSLRMLAGLESITEGAIYIGERCVNDTPPRYRDVAMVFQNYALYPHMTVSQNIAYPLLIRGEKREEIVKQVRRISEMMELGDFLARRPRELSGGQRQRVALARAVIRRPVAFLMDEPLSNLDAQLRLSMRGELKRLQRELRITTLYVTHDQAEAMTLAHRIAVMRDGQLQQTGSPTELYRHPKNIFVAGFLGSPPMNLVTGGVEEQGFCFEGGSIYLTPEQRSAARAESLVIGFRPSMIFLVSPDKDRALRGMVYVTEQMGNETYVFLKCGEQILTVRAEADFQAEIGDILGVEVPSSAIHLFDGKTGERVGN